VRKRFQINWKDILMQPPQHPVPAIIFDSSFDEGIDQVLALAMLFGLQTKGQARLASVSISRNDVKSASFLDLMARFYAGEQTGAGGFPPRTYLPAGMYADGPASKSVPPMLEAVLSKAVYKRGVEKLNDTADPVALIRNALSAQTDDSAAIVLAGRTANLLGLLALADGKQWAERKTHVLAIAAGRFDASQANATIKGDVLGYRKLLAEWTGAVVFVGAEAGEALPFPASSIDSNFAWASNHPVADAYRAYKAMPYDASTRAMAAVLYAAQPNENYFKLSEPGTVKILDDGRTEFTAAPNGKHRYLIDDPAQKDRVIEAYVKLASAQPPPPPQRRGAPPAAKEAAKLIVIGALAGLLATAPLKLDGQDQADFDKSTRPLLTQTCAGCHNAKLTSGGLDVTELTSSESLTSHRASWEKILRRLRAGEMPPPGIPKPPAERVTALTTFVQKAFDQADAKTAADPGRVTAHRLNRNEYTNTIRDLLGVQFRAEKYFPTDDSGDGFDNIGDVLTVSPVLMERYMAAAEQIAKWALSTEIPPKPLDFLYHTKEKKIRRIDRSTIEAEHRVDYAGEYTIRIGLPGERAKNAAPVTLGFWMDGKLLQTKTAETKPSGLVYFDPFSDEEFRLYLPEGDHVFRAGFIADNFVNTLSDKDAYNRKVNKFLESIDFVGPFPSKTVKESRKKILICDPATGKACMERIVSTLARRAYRRPITSGEVAALVRFASMAQQDGQSAEQGLQLAIQAMLVSPNFLFHIEHDPRKDSHKISEFELASRLSYFLWSSMPDDELLDRAQAGTLRASLDQEVDRMLADPRAAAFAQNFAGQWLETRNLDVVKPDPDKFPQWDPELRDAMKQETSMFFEYVLRENRPISDFLDARYTFLNARLAKHYGITGVTGNEFRRVDLADNEQRGGILSHASVLTVSSYPTRTSPVIRGKYILQNVLGSPPPPPPPDVPVLDEAAIGATMSMREQLEKHRADATCAACHSKMDPLGFGLENYDAIGKWREKDGKFPVDSSGVLPNGKTFSTPAEMRGILTSQLPQFSRTLTEKMLTYAIGRGLKPYDNRTVDSINQELEKNGYKFQSLVHQIVNSLPFESRRGEAQ
jgi:mono/diheme cytochrome c family protein